jgi:hypothetical protein
MESLLKVIDWPGEEDCITVRYINFSSCSMSCSVIALMVSSVLCSSDTSTVRKTMLKKIYCIVSCCMLAKSCGQLGDSRYIIGCCRFSAWTGDNPVVFLQPLKDLTMLTCLSMYKTVLQITNTSSLSCLK